MTTVGVHQRVGAWLWGPLTIATRLAWVGAGVGVSVGACVGAPNPPATDASEDGDETLGESTTDGPGEWASVIDQSAWMVLEAGEDPLAAHRPEMIDCGLAGWYVEDDELDVDTNFCNYLGLGQPSLVPITEGHGVRLGLYHFDLVAAEPALAHLAVLVDGQPLWEQEIEIPGPAQVFEVEFEAPFTAPAGSEVVFHLHNHGQNSWVLQAITAEL